MFDAKLFDKNETKTPHRKNSSPLTLKATTTNRQAGRIWEVQELIPCDS